MAHEHQDDTASGVSVDRDEVAQFSALADQWWEPDGKFRPLHKFNPVRISYIRDRICEAFGGDPRSATPFAGRAILDIGCGGGLLSEPMARLGARVTGVDASARNIAIAKAHAGQMELDIDYRCTSAEDLAASGARFDFILNMEVIEHVADIQSFMNACAEMLRPGGGMVIATLNRTLKSFGLAIVGAEYVLRWLPRGTHDWRKFVRPHELARATRRSGLQLADLSGVSYSPLSDRWSLSKDLDVNYLAFARKSMS